MCENSAIKNESDRMDLLLQERNSIAGSDRVADTFIEMGNATRDSLRSQNQTIKSSIQRMVDFRGL